MRTPNGIFRPPSRRKAHLITIFIFSFLFAQSQKLDLTRVPLLGDTSEEVTFYINIHPKPAEEISFSIDFGDGFNYQSPLLGSGEIEVSHRYTQPGKYLIKIIAGTAQKELAREETEIEIKENIFSARWELPGATVSTPALDEHGNLYLGIEENALLSFSPSGSKRFSFMTRGPVLATPMVIGHRVIFGSLDSTLYCIDTTGFLLWQFPAASEIYSCPASDGKRIIFTTDDGGVVSIGLNGKLLWQKKIGPEPSSPTLDAKGNIYVSSDGVYKISPAGQILFKFSTPDQDAFLTAPILSPDGALFCGAEDGNLYCLNQRGELLWKAPTEEEDPIRCEGVFLGDTFIFGCDDGVLYKKERYGGLKKVFSTDGAIIASPVLTNDGKLFILSDDGLLYALAPDGRLLFSKEIAYSEKNYLITPSLTLTRDGILIITSWDDAIFTYPAGPAYKKSIWYTYRGNFQRTGVGGAKEKR